MHKILVVTYVMLAFIFAVIMSTSSLRLFQLAWVRARTNSAISQKLSNLRHGNRIEDQNI